MTDLKITGLHKHFAGGVHAVRGIDLTVPAGQFTVLVGPSGCGKSTLLRTIAGLEEADQGTIEIGGRLVNHVRPRDRDIAMVFQNYALYPYMNVYENIAFGLRARKTAAAEIDKRVRRAAEMLGIEALLDRLPRQLSGGQRQRVAIGRAIVRDAKMFLFDEPLSNLDAQLRDEMRGEIKRLHQDLRKTIVYVTHDQIEAMTLADCVVLMRDGLIEQHGAPLDLFEHPATQFVAGFLGSPQMNFIPCRLVNNDGNIELIFETGDKLPLHRTLPNGAGAQQGRNLLFGVRPEHFTPLGKGTVLGSGQTVITARIELIQPTGARTFVQFPFGGTQTTAELPAHSVEQPGTEVQIVIDMSRTILIDAASGRVVSHASRM
jgi:multiple sugar transport system ATP-binding protein